MGSLLEVKDLKMHFPIYGGILRRRIGTIHAVNGVSFNIMPGETVGLVGESGCGKTTVGRTIARLYRATEGEVTFDGIDLFNYPKKQMKLIRRDLQIVFQDPFESLNSRHTVATILEEPFIIHNLGTPSERKREVKLLLERVGLSVNALNKFPHEFSGGQRQRIGIARAIALKPKLIICDEPVSALDVAIQSQIINLLLELQKEMSLAFLFIAHDLSVVRHVSDRIAVMYLGKIVEFMDAEVIYQEPKHPYTRALLSAIPLPDPNRKVSPQLLEGDVPSPIRLPRGCGFHPRCPYAQDICRRQAPELRAIGGGKHLVACHFSEELFS
ncbi:MAG: ATP-binding cassette domain-containing protein [Bdellovibrionota bacterium]